MNTENVSSENETSNGILNAVSSSFLVINTKNILFSRRKWYFIDNLCIGRKCFSPSKDKQTPTCIYLLMKCGCQMINNKFYENIKAIHENAGWNNYR